ncbi:hypothetical protein SNE40_015941 [Patella caerulea]|uniref:Uncharacterized protein n=1 Tax=Patella caerulea TaxID=87958 RepID=A0AAN8JBZ1_PATCE
MDPPETDLDFILRPENYVGTNLTTIRFIATTDKKEKPQKSNKSKRSKFEQELYRRYRHILPIDEQDHADELENEDDEEQAEEEADDTIKEEDEQNEQAQTKDESTVSKPEEIPEVRAVSPDLKPDPSTSLEPTTDSPSSMALRPRDSLPGHTISSLSTTQLTSSPKRGNAQPFSRGNKIKANKELRAKIVSMANLC